jgi:dipeptidyl aminopeptidase/acylaminoacyl peptidase
MNDPRWLGLTTRMLASLIVGVLLVPTGAGASPPILPHSLWVMDADGTDARRLVRYTAHDAALPEWSPDGTRVAVEKAQQILVVEVATADKTFLTEEGLTGTPRGPPMERRSLSPVCATRPERTSTPSRRMEQV